jgi:hypothetical protein
MNPFMKHIMLVYAWAFLASLLFSRMGVPITGLDRMPAYAYAILGAILAGRSRNV